MIKARTVDAAAGIEADMGHNFNEAGCRVDRVGAGVK
jgi:hypothetical protein